MESLYLLIPISLILLAVAVAVFFWAVNSGQYDDIDREGERILFDDEPESRPGKAPPKPEEESGEKRDG